MQRAFFQFDDPGQAVALEGRVDAGHRRHAQDRCLVGRQLFDGAYGIAGRRFQGICIERRRFVENQPQITGPAEDGGGHRLAPVKTHADGIRRPQGLAGHGRGRRCGRGAVAWGRFACRLSRCFGLRLAFGFRHQGNRFIERFRRPGRRLRSRGRRGGGGGLLFGRGRRLAGGFCRGSRRGRRTVRLCLGRGFGLLRGLGIGGPDVEHHFRARLEMPEAGPLRHRQTGRHRSVTGLGGNGIEVFQAAGADGIEVEGGRAVEGNAGGRACFSDPIGHPARPVEDQAGITGMFTGPHPHRRPGGSRLRSRGFGLSRLGGGCRAVLRRSDLDKDALADIEGITSHTRTHLDGDRAAVFPRRHLADIASQPPADADVGGFDGAAETDRQAVAVLRHLIADGALPIKDDLAVTVLRFGPHPHRFGGDRNGNRQARRQHRHRQTGGGHQAEQARQGPHDQSPTVGMMTISTRRARARLRSSATSGKVPY